MTIGRRRLLGIVLLGLATRWASSVAGIAAVSEDALRNIRWRVPIAHVDTVKRNLRFNGTVTEEKDLKGAALIFVFIGAVLLPYLADAVLALRREMVHGGLIIDTRGADVVIDNDQRLDAGVIVVITPSGTDLYERDDIENPSELVAALLKGR
jgi:hypothetical protein